MTTLHDLLNEISEERKHGIAQRELVIVESMLRKRSDQISHWFHYLKGDLSNKKKRRATNKLAKAQQDLKHLMIIQADLRAYIER